MSTLIHAGRYEAFRTAAQPRAGQRTWYGHLLWVAAAALLSFAITAIFSDAIELSRDVFLLIYASVTSLFVYGYVRWSETDINQELHRHLVRGLIGAVLVGGVVVLSVQRMDASPRAEGLELAWDIVWLGVIYGAIDALLLNVLPVMGVWRAATRLGHTATRLGKLVTGALGLIASLGVTAAYHLGYAEYHGTEVIDPLFGNTIMTLGYLVFANPVTAVVAHVALHIASAIHGVDTTVTLPPHY